MNKRLISVTLSALLITLLFHRQELGLNLLIYEIGLISWLILSKQLAIKLNRNIVYVIGVVITAFCTVLIHSSLSIFINIISLIILIGILISPDLRSPLNAVSLSLSNILKSQRLFISELRQSELIGNRLGSKIWKTRIFIIPLLIIILFVFIYRKSNPVFDDLNSKVGLFISNKLQQIFQDFDFLLIGTIAIALIISNYLIFRTKKRTIIDRDKNASDILERTKKVASRQFKITALRNEYKAGVFLLIVLNTIILILNSIDIYWVWFNFEWEGQYLKQFVHEGTYLLILSILISITLVLYFFKRNLNFYNKNALLKILSYIWIGQNAILTISVGVRNFWYINYFSLAYKRIGVIIFLLLTIYGLYTVYTKVRYKKSTFYLFKTNSHVLFLTLVVCATINWDMLIARYNFNNAENSFLHLDYMVTLSDKTLPIIDQPLNELKRICKTQNELFPFEQTFMKPEYYYSEIQNRKSEFIQSWESKTFLAWNLPEYSAYKELIDK